MHIKSFEERLDNIELVQSINNLSRRIERFNSFNDAGNDSNHWKGKKIIPLNEWIRLRGTPYALEYYPNESDKYRHF